MQDRITLIKPNMYGSRSKGALQPLFAAALTAHTPPDIEVKLYDERIEEIPFDEPTDLVAISMETFCARHAYDIAREYRKRGVPVLAGGYHPTLMPEECLQHTDAIVEGDAEKVWPYILRDLKHKQLKVRYSQKEFVPPDLIRYTRDIFADKPYGPIEMVQWGRGCPNDCEFCSVKSFYPSGQVCRSVDSVIGEVEGMSNRTIFFIDDNLFHNRHLLMDFLRALAPLKLKWICQIPVTIAHDEELLRLMAQSGCMVVLLGIESFNTDNLRLMNKEWNNSRLDYDTAVRKIKSFGIQIYGTFIFGYDYDTVDSFNYSVDFALKHNFFIANFNPLYPLPGSRLYARYKKEGRLVDTWWLEENFYYGKSMFEPRGMSSRELEVNCYQAKLRFNSYPSILQRGINLFRQDLRLKELILFFYANYINRKEIIHKQGKLLGP